MAASRSRTDIAPLTWEVPAAGLAGWAVLAALLLPAGRGLATIVTGHGFQWPHGSPRILASIGGLLTGHPDKGLDPAGSSALPPLLLIYALIIAGEVLLAGLTTWLVVLWWHRLGPGARDGMASRVEVHAVLGIANLHRRRALIRPDLHPNGDPVEEADSTS
jgi:type IV secretion system protein VirD4